MSDRQYRDVAGNPCTLRWLVKNEPEWAENQIRHRDTLERELAAAKERIARLEEAGKNLIKAESDIDLSAIDHAIGEFERVMEAKP